VGAGDLLVQPTDSGLKMETVTYGLPVIAALIVATRPASIRGKLEALATAMTVLTGLTVLAVIAWARLVSLQAYDQMVFDTTLRKGHTAAFTYYCFHGYAFSQPVIAVLLWMASSMSGLFDRPTSAIRNPIPSHPKAPCSCGSGRQYRRCCGKSVRPAK